MRILRDPLKQERHLIAILMDGKLEEAQSVIKEIIENDKRLAQLEVEKAELKYLTKPSK